MSQTNNVLPNPPTCLGDRVEHTVAAAGTHAVLICYAVYGTIIPLLRVEIMICPYGTVRGVFRPLEHFVAPRRH